MLIDNIVSKLDREKDALIVHVGHSTSINFAVENCKCKITSGKQAEIGTVSKRQDQLMVYKRSFIVNCCRAIRAQELGMTGESYLNDGKNDKCYLFRNNSSFSCVISAPDIINKCLTRAKQLLPSTGSTSMDWSAGAK